MADNLAITIISVLATALVAVLGILFPIVRAIMPRHDIQVEFSALQAQLTSQLRAIHDLDNRLSRIEERLAVYFRERPKE